MPARNMFIKWLPENCTNIPIIDEHHRGICSLINTLYYFMQENHGKDVVMPVLAMLEEYMKIHAFVEERLMEDSDYEGLEGHRKAHKFLLLEMTRISGSFKDSANPDEQLLAFMKKLWTIHFMDYDKKYTQSVISYLNENKE